MNQEQSQAAHIENPLRVGMTGERQPEPCAMVIFGATGDLTKRKLVPALYTLARERLLPSSFAIVGFARREIPFAEQMRDGVSRYARRRPIDEGLWSTFAGGLSYVTGNFDDPQAYLRLKEHLAQVDQQRGTAGNRVFYISTPPESFAPIIRNLGAAGLIDHSPGQSPKTASGSSRGAPFTRVIIEKPFGHDLGSATALNDVCHEVLREDQIYRIDHYLGKETVQNIQVFRFANGLFEPLWNGKYIDNVQLTVAEAIGIEGRGNYYDVAGTLRDMVQNHMFQLLTLVAMEPPVAFEADAVRDEKVKVLRALRAPDGDLAKVRQGTVRAQYAPGFDQGQPVPGFLSEKDVAPDSLTETFVALKLYIDNWRWGGVPFYLRAAKRMPKRVTEIAITFRSVPHALFAGATENNVLALRIQPDEGITLKFLSKVPGPTSDPRPVTMDFRYGSTFGNEPPEAYERLLLDCMLGDGTLFTRGDEVLASWRYCSKLLEAWQDENQQLKQSGARLPSYEAGTWGPHAATELLTRDGRAWRKP